MLTYDVEGTFHTEQVYLTQMPDSEAVLDWITQVSKKNWATPLIVGDLVILLNAVLHFQGNYCGGAMTREGCPVELRPIPANTPGYTD